MKAMVLHKLSNLEENRTPLEMTDLPVPEPETKEILVKVLSSVRRGLENQK